jgi:hypothetical protein
MSAGPSVTASSGGCAEADLEAEAPESTPEEGARTARRWDGRSQSPVLEESIDGTLYRATPNENFADSAMALYVVLKDAAWA